jgi:hypothetical protein
LLEHVERSPNAIGLVYDSLELDKEAFVEWEIYYLISLGNEA